MNEQSTISAMIFYSKYKLLNIISLSILLIYCFGHPAYAQQSKEGGYSNADIENLYSKIGEIDRKILEYSSKINTYRYYDEAQNHKNIFDEKNSSCHHNFQNEVVPNAEHYALNECLYDSAQTRLRNISVSLDKSIKLFDEMSRNQQNAFTKNNYASNSPTAADVFNAAIDAGDVRNNNAYNNKPDSESKKHALTEASSAETEYKKNNQNYNVDKNPLIVNILTIILTPLFGYGLYKFVIFLTTDPCPNCGARLKLSESSYIVIDREIRFKEVQRSVRDQNGDVISKYYETVPYNAVLVERSPSCKECGHKWTLTRWEED